MNIIQGIDESIVLYFAEHLRNSVLNAIMVFITTLGNAGAVWLILGAVLMVFKKHRQRGFALLVCVGLCTVVSTLVLKNIIARPRPFVELTSLTILIPPPGGFSFPSGHAASSFAAAYALARGYGKRGALSYVLASLIALSRVYVGVHYPSDIIVGAAVGMLCAWAAYEVMLRIVRRKRLD